MSSSVISTPGLQPDFMWQLSKLFSGTWITMIYSNDNECLEVSLLLLCEANPQSQSIQRLSVRLLWNCTKEKTMPSPCLLVFVVAYHSLPNFLFGFELRLSHFITGLKDWNKDCPLFFFLDWYLFFYLTYVPVFELPARLPFRYLFLHLSPIIIRINVFFPPFFFSSTL